MSKKHVTVLMPCKDPHPGFFQKALHSVFNQTSELWDLIIIDDHSENEQTLTILDDIRNKEDKRIRIVKNDSMYVTGALNTGMRHARTPFVCSLHCDDLLDKKAIEVLNQNISDQPETDYFHSARIHIDENDEPVSPVYNARPSFSLDDFKHFGPVKHLHCWRVTFALHIGGMDESLGLHGADDYDFVWSMAENGCIFRAIPDCLYYYRNHSAHYRLTTHVPQQIQVSELTRIFKKHGMADDEIHDEIEARKAGYLSQALIK